MSGKLKLQYGQGDLFSCSSVFNSESLVPRVLRTMVSIFFAYFGSICIQNKQIYINK